MIRAVFLAAIFGTCSSSSTTVPPAAPSTPEAVGKPAVENPLVVFRQVLERHAQSRGRTPADLPNRIVDCVVLASYHNQFAAGYQKARTKQPDADPMLVAELERRHRGEAGKWTSLADAAAAELRAAQGPAPMSVRVEDYDRDAFCGQWASDWPDDAERLQLVEYCTKVHTAAEVKAAEVASLVPACEGPASFGGGSLVVAILCQRAPAPPGEPSFPAAEEGQLVSINDPDGGTTTRMTLTLAVEPATRVRAIVLTASQSDEDPKRGYLTIGLSEVVDVSLGMGITSLPCQDVELWRSEKWKRTESTKGNQRYTTVVDATYDSGDRVTRASLPAGALAEYARSRHAGGSYCGLSFELSADQLERLRAFAKAAYSR